MSFRDGGLVFDPKMVDMDKGINGDVRTAKLMRKMANSVMPKVMIMEEGCP